MCYSSAHVDDSHGRGEMLQLARLCRNFSNVSNELLSMNELVSRVARMWRSWLCFGDSDLSMPLKQNLLETIKHGDCAEYARKGFLAFLTGKRSCCLVQGCHHRAGTAGLHRMHSPWLEPVSLLFGSPGGLLGQCDLEQC